MKHNLSHSLSFFPTLFLLLVSFSLAHQNRSRINCMQRVFKSSAIYNRTKDNVQLVFINDNLSNRREKNYLKLCSRVHKQFQREKRTEKKGISLALTYQQHTHKASLSDAEKLILIIRSREKEPVRRN